MLVKSQLVCLPPVEIIILLYLVDMFVSRFYLSGMPVNSELGVGKYITHHKQQRLNILLNNCSETS